MSLAGCRRIPRKGLADGSQVRLRVERLEVRALLSQMSYNLTTDNTVYQLGQSINFTFTETNTSSQPVAVENGPSVDGFDVSQNGTVVWSSNAGATPLDIEQQTLQPGKSLTETGTWNGTSTNGTSTPLTGSFTVTNQLAPSAASATFQIAQPITYSLATKNASYQVGQPIQITLTATNTSLETVSVNTAPGTFVITQGDNTIWNSSGQQQVYAASAASLPTQPLAHWAVDHSDGHLGRDKQLAGAVCQ